MDSALPSRKLALGLLAGLLLCSLSAVATSGSADGPQWLSEVRAAVASGKLDNALALVEARISADPADLEAHGWKARLLAWKNSYPEAETEYRFVLSRRPDDVDMLLGLADVLHWDGKNAEALQVLDRARSLAPRQTDILVRRGRVLAALKRNAEARSDFREALAINSKDENARVGLESLAAEGRHRVQVGSDIDGFNYTGTAVAESVALASRWNSSWATNFSVDVYQRFGERAAKFSGIVTRNLTRSDWLSVGAAAGDDQGIIPKSEALFSYGHALRLDNPLVRGLEASYDQHWYWYRSAHIFTAGGTALVYFPRNWTWLLSINAARSAFANVPGHDWQPNGRTRLSFPLARRLSGNLTFAVGSETFAEIDQTGHFAARTYGGGIAYSFNNTQDVSAFIAMQDRSQGRSQTSGGVSYGFRF